MSLTLYSSPSWRTAGCKVQVLLKILGTQCQIKRIPFADWKSPEYLAIHPFGKIPSLETPEGPIFESMTIMRYFARRAGKMYGNSPAETAQIDQWLEFYNSQFYPLLSQVYATILGGGANYVTLNKEKYEAALEQLDEVIKIIDVYLKDNKYLGSKDLSIADVAFGAISIFYFRLLMDEKLRTANPNFTKWITNLYEHPAFVAHFGKLWVCQKQFTPIFEVAKKEEKAKKEDKPKEQKKKEQKPKEVAKEQKGKKEGKKDGKKEEKKKKEQSDQEEDKPYEEKKKTNPLDLLPKSPFILDDFKREFVNSADKPAVLKNLWEKFDSPGWSLWKLHYIKYEGEGKIGYLTANLKNGFLRNIDHFRKYSFGVMGVYGSEGNYEIDGVFLWRGDEIPGEWKEHQSYDYFNFIKLDHADKNNQKLAEDYWLLLNQGDMVDNHAVFEAKWFK